MRSYDLWWCNFLILSVSLYFRKIQRWFLCRRLMLYWILKSLSSFDEHKWINHDKWVNVINDRKQKVRIDKIESITQHEIPLCEVMLFRQGSWCSPFTISKGWFDFLVIIVMSVSNGGEAFSAYVPDMCIFRKKFIVKEIKMCCLRICSSRLLRIHTDDKASIHEGFIP